MLWYLLILQVRYEALRNRCSNCSLQERWEGLMVQYSRRFAERQANLFVVAATTPAQVRKSSGIASLS